MRIFHEPATEQAAEIYARIVGIEGKCKLKAHDVLPHDEITDLRADGVVPLFMNTALNSNLRHRFFGNPGVVGFADHQYVPSQSEHASPELATIGTTEHGLGILSAHASHADLQGLQRERNERMHALLGPDMFTHIDMRDLLQSPKARSVRIHALGPQGTNIQQVADQYVELHGLQDRATVVVHDRGVEPMQYAELAAREMEDGVLPLHIECAVYYGMRDLYQQRMQELVFADHHYMPLDSMQLAARGALPDQEMLRLASHPSPIGLVDPWLQAGVAQHQKASSNSDAAAQVVDGNADACITTESGRVQYNLQQIQDFGRPMMIFTLGTPYDADTLRTRFGS